jgi:hypothetical protein
MTYTVASAEIGTRINALRARTVKHHLNRNSGQQNASCTIAGAIMMLRQRFLEHSQSQYYLVQGASHNAKQAMRRTGREVHERCTGSLLIRGERVKILRDL